MTLADRLRILAGTLPPLGSVTFTRADLLELLAETENTPGLRRNATEPAADLTVGQVAALFARASNTVRSWLIAGQFPSAYRLRGREWRIPRSDIEAMQRAEAERFRQKSKEPASPESEPDLGAWRQHVQRKGA